MPKVTTHNRTIIGLTGHKGVGKSTAAAMLLEMLPDPPIGHKGIVAFADALKEDIREMLELWGRIDLTREELEATKGEILGPMAQGYGQYRRHYFGESYWIDRWQTAVREWNIQTVIVPDVRYPNEASAIRRLGGVVIGIGGTSRWENDTRSMEHPSEKHVDSLVQDADHYVANSGSLDFLREQLEDCLNRMDTRKKALIPA